jgi:hypothetical protein
MASVARSSFQTAVEAGDAEAVRSCLADDVVFHSPVTHAPYHGREAVAGIIAAALDVFEDFHYISGITEGDRHTLVFEARVGDRAVQGADILRLSADGQVAELTVMVRPLSGIQALAEAMRRRLATA